jgi:hypothetical protein
MVLLMTPTIPTTEPITDTIALLQMLLRQKKNLLHINPHDFDECKVERDRLLVPKADYGEASSFMAVREM